jgi:hypothetical protein
MLQQRPRSVLISRHAPHVIGDRTAEWQEHTGGIERHQADSAEVLEV